MATRETALSQWFLNLLPTLGISRDMISSASDQQLTVVSGDASFRRYFRGSVGGRSWILVDAPPAHENCRGFVAVARRLLMEGVNVPVVHAVDYEQGFMCLSDLGDNLLWDALRQADTEQAAEHYRRAMRELLLIQRCEPGPGFDLPPYDAALLMREMGLFREWFCGGLMSLDLSQSEEQLLADTFDYLRDAALAQPRVCVHRDYHSRNLMLIEGQPPGVLDFQDAVWGPLTYDLVSLLKDCYVAWPATQVKQWALEFRDMLAHETKVPELAEDAFLLGFDLMGAQRHLKAIGIFARLCLRDGKPRYLEDIPRTLSYLREVALAEPRLATFAAWLDARIMPGLEAALRQGKQRLGSCAEVSS